MNSTMIFGSHTHTVQPLLTSFVFIYQRMRASLEDRRWELDSLHEAERGEIFVIIGASTVPALYNLQTSSILQ